MFQFSLNLNSLQQKFSLTSNYLGTNILVKRVACNSLYISGYPLILVLLLNNDFSAVIKQTKKYGQPALMSQKYQAYLSPGHAEYFSPICILLTGSIPVVSMYFQSERKTNWIMIRWLRQNPADLDLQCFQKSKKDKSWFSRTRVNSDLHSNCMTFFVCFLD